MKLLTGLALLLGEFSGFADRDPPTFDAEREFAITDSNQDWEEFDDGHDHFMDYDALARIPRPHPRDLLGVSKGRQQVEMIFTTTASRESTRSTSFSEPPGATTTTTSEPTRTTTPTTSQSTKTATTKSESTRAITTTKESRTTTPIEAARTATTSEINRASTASDPTRPATTSQSTRVSKITMSESTRTTKLPTNERARTSIFTFRESTIRRTTPRPTSPCPCTCKRGPNGQPKVKSTGPRDGEEFPAYSPALFTRDKAKSASTLNVCQIHCKRSTTCVIARGSVCLDGVCKNLFVNQLGQVCFRTNPKSCHESLYSPLPC